MAIPPAMFGALFLLLTTVTAMCSDREPAENVGGGWFIEDQGKLPGAGPEHIALVRDATDGRRVVDELIEKYRFYEPDCVVYQTARADHHLFAVCGDRLPVAVESSMVVPWTLEAEGARRTKPLIVRGGTLIRVVEEIPVERMKRAAMEQPAMREGMRPRSFDPAAAAVQPVVREEIADFKPAPAEAAPYLIRAAIAGDATMADALIAAGGDANATNDAGMTPLMFAASNRNSEVVRRLLAAGADVNRQDSSGRTALMNAAGVGAREIAAMLIRAGADKALRDREGRTAADRLAGSQDMELLQLLEARP